MEWQVWIAYFVASWAIALSPGSGAVLSMTHGLAYGVRGASATILGLQLGAVLTGPIMDYYTPLEHRKQSFKEFMREWIVGQFERSLIDLGARHFYVSNLPAKKTVATLNAILDKAGVTATSR